MQIRIRSVDMVLLIGGLAIVAFSIVSARSVDVAAENTESEVSREADLKQSDSPLRAFYERIDVDHKGLLKASPFAVDRSDYARNRTGANRQNVRPRVRAKDIRVLGVYRQAGVWKAQIKIPNETAPRTVQRGDETSVGTIEEVSETGVTISTDGGGNQKLRGPFGLRESNTRFDGEPVGGPNE